MVPPADASHAHARHPREGHDVAAPRLLCLDTSTQRMVLALTDGGHGGQDDVTHGLEEEGGARASARLLPAVAELLARAGLALEDLHSIAFARGPGGFTGLRTAASAAQGLAFGLNVPVLAIDSLMLVAEDARMQVTLAEGEAVAVAEAWTIAVAMDARMGEIYAATYRYADDGWTVIDAPMLIDPESLAAHWQLMSPGVVAGSAIELHAALRSAASTASSTSSSIARVVSNIAHAPAALAALARRAWREGKAVHARDAQPLYVRDKVAFTTLERDAMRAQASGPAQGSRA